MSEIYVILGGVFFIGFVLLCIAFVIEFFLGTRPLSQWRGRAGAAIVCALMVIGGVFGAVTTENGVDWQALLFIGLIVLGTEATMYLSKRFRHHS